MIKQLSSVYFFIFPRFHQEFELFKEFVSIKNGRGRHRGRGRGRGAGHHSHRAPTQSRPNADSGEAESHRLEGSSTASNRGAFRSGNIMSHRRGSQGKNSERNSRQRDNLRARCSRAEAQADSLKHSLKLCIEELEDLKKSRSSTEAYIGDLKAELERSKNGQTLALEELEHTKEGLELAKAELLALKASNQTLSAGEAASFGSEVQALDTIIQAMDC